ncbi:MAG TPA: hypothetical protein VE110_07790 [Gemmatimonadaceae bacterium]|nr:hypothetical protein [Gemmatimonadaceae bacterium]
MNSFARSLAIVCATLILPVTGSAQDTAAMRLDVGAQATWVATRESPAIGGRALTEGYLTQPVLMTTLGLWNDALSLRNTLDFEGATIRRGELNAGIFGEGYIDRRHPHTYVHELTATAEHSFAGTAVSLTAGKGFAPFGTDDPMSRPFEKYPINHHLAQIPERAIAIAALRSGSLVLDGGLFNGDEPESPGDTPNKNRYWDSWSARATFLPISQAELQASYARVKSPENATGGGADQRKHSASIRLEDAQHSGYALLEWAHTREYLGATTTIAYTSVLAETWTRYGKLNGGLRLESTERPDEDRLLDPFRTPVPPTDPGFIGRSHWTIITARLAGGFNLGRFGLEPFTELAGMHVSETLKPSGFDPRAFYGSNRIWSISVGAKLSFGMHHMRMGRYGAAITDGMRAPRSGGGMPGMNMMETPRPFPAD